MKHKLLLSTLIAVLFLTSCTAKPSPQNQGEIKDIEVSEKIEIVIEDPLFEKEENPFSYLTKAFSDPRAKLSFEIPTDWSVEVITGRLYQVTAPPTDPYLPGFIILISHEYNVADRVTADSLHTLFSNELTEYTYRIGGEGYSIVDMPSPKDATDDPKYALKSDIVSLRTYSDVVFMKKDKTGINKGTLNMINAYINWPNAPTLLSGVVTPQYEENAIKMMNYIISSMKETRIEIDSEKVYEIGGYSFSAYSDFIKEGSLLTTSGLTPISGLGVGVFKFNEKIDGKNTSAYITRMIRETLNINGEFMPFVNLKDDQSYLAGCPVLIYEGSSSFVAKGGETSYYGSGGNIFYTTYFMERNDASHAIIVTYETNQIELGERLCRMIENTLKYK